MIEEKKKALYGVLARFETPDDLTHACEKVRDRGFKEWDAYSPFPVHGLDKSMGLKPSKLPFIVFVSAVLHGGAAFLLWSWMNAVDYKYVIAGKPFFSWQVYMIPGIEVVFLTGALTCLLGLLGLAKLPFWSHPLHHCESFKRATDDHFFISIEAKDPYFDIVSTPKYLREMGAISVELFGEE